MLQSNDIRLAVDSGEVALGIKQVLKSIKNNTAKLVITAVKNKEEVLNDIKYLTNISNIKLEIFKGNSTELGSTCGKPYSVSTLSIIDPGHSNILNNLNSNRDKEEKNPEEKETEEESNKEEINEQQSD